MSYDFNDGIVATINGFKNYENGGKGSGNFGHAGRPGKVGGSASTGSKQKDYKVEQEGVDSRDGYAIGTEFARLQAQLSTARTNLKMLKRDSKKASTDSVGRSTYLARSSEIARALRDGELLSNTKLSKKTKQLVKEMVAELKSIESEYRELGE